VFAVAALAGLSPDRWGLLVLAAAIGYFLPRFVLKRRISKRNRTIQLGLPDALDLAIICVEAGLSLDQALQRVGQELEQVHPELSDELRLMTLEVRAGKTRAEALRNLGLRVNIDDLRAVIAVLLQTDRFGTSVAQALRVHSDGLRTERRQRAEEAAAKTTIKMVPVLVFFVFPPMFFVVLGPAVIQMIRVLLPELSH
jgi:tight adherence protein C